MKFLAYDDLRPAKGIGYSKVQLWRLEKRNEFPKRVPYGRGRHGWVEQEIDAWMTERIRQRDSAVAARLAVPSASVTLNTPSPPDALAKDVTSATNSRLSRSAPPTIADLKSK